MSKTIQPHILRQFVLVREMGSGAYGHVWQVQEKRSGCKFALKKLFDAFRNSVDAQRTYRQADILYKMNHQNIIKLHRVIRAKNDKDLYMVFEYMEADLHSVVGTKILQKIHQKYIMYQILSALKYLHEAQLIHRDLKPSNVLINTQCTIKLCDFGLVRSVINFQSQQQVMSEEVATKWYRAPEVLLNSQSYDKPVDLWGVGCILGQMMLGRPLFEGDLRLNQLEKILQFVGKVTPQDTQSLQSPTAQQLIREIYILNSSRQQILSKIDPEFHQLILGLIQFNPNKRMTADQALNLDIFKQFRETQPQDKIQPIVPSLDDNIRFDTIFYRKTIYQNIELRYGLNEINTIETNQIKHCSQHKQGNRSQSLLKNTELYNRKQGINERKSIHNNPSSVHRSYSKFPVEVKKYVSSLNKRLFQQVQPQIVAKSPFRLTEFRSKQCNLQGKNFPKLICPYLSSVKKKINLQSKLQKYQKENRSDDLTKQGNQNLGLRHKGEIMLSRINR